MKIFNWVHRKFQQNADSYSVCPKKEGGKLPLKEKKQEIHTNDAHDKEVLLDSVTLVEVLDGWKDGILTIGTFGFDPLKENQEFSLNNNNNEEEEEEDTDEKDEKILNPEVVKAFEIEFHKEMSSNLDTTSVKTLDHLTPIVEDAPLLKFIESPEIKVEELETDTKKRTTLADLFSADSVDDTAMKKSGFDEEKSELNKKSSAAIIGHSSGKKLMSRKGETRVIKKLHKMVTKMLRKKIHPDLESKQVRGNKEGSSIANESTVEMMNGNGVPAAAHCIQAATA